MYYCSGCTLAYTEGATADTSYKVSDSPQIVQGINVVIQS